MALHKEIAKKKAACGPISHKEFLFEVKQPTITERTVCGYLAVFGNKDSDCDILVKGCFANSITERGPQSTSGNKIAHLWQHQMDKPLGKITKLLEDDYGLYFECTYDDIQLANDALVQIKSGTLNKFSIGFNYVWEKMEYDEGKDAFICMELRLWEGSVVTLAANDLTYVTGLKSEQRKCLVEDLMSEFEENMPGIKSMTQYNLRQIFSKLKALAEAEPNVDQKEKLRQQALEEKNAQQEAATTKKKRFAKLSELKA